jgi:hypothetical protein
MSVTALQQRPPKSHRELLDAFSALSKSYGNDIGVLIMGEIVELQENIQMLEQRIEALEMKQGKRR